MNFTREPIIETVITPREGCKLVVRSSKGVAQEDYYVDAVEVVSFGHSFFFRSQERPKSFLVPVSDYEILELKETRMVLKNVTTDRSIKIGGGRDGAPSRRESEPRSEALADSRPAPERSQERHMSKRRRGRRGRDRNAPNPQEMREQRPEQLEEEHRLAEDRLPVESNERSSEGGEIENKTPSFISKLFPPPSTLIKETLSRSKPSEAPSGQEGFSVEAIFEETIFEHPTPKEKELEDDNEE